MIRTAIPTHSTVQTFVYTHSKVSVHCLNGTFLMEHGLFQEAIDAFKKALIEKPNHPLARTYLSFCAQQLDPQAEFSEENADPEALYKISQLFSSGRGVASSNETALKWLQKAAAKGYIPAIIKLHRSLPKVIVI